MTVMPREAQIYLASQSPRRRELLRQIGVTFQALPVEVDEALGSPHEPAAEYVRRLALEKARTGWRQVRHHHPRPVLGADTAVAVDERILGKPADRADGLAMLALLSGRTHRVLTAVALCWDGQHRVSLSASEVSFRPLSDAERAAYWASGEPRDKAGAYAIQGLAALFITRIAGSYSGIVGLPLLETGELLRAANIYGLEAVTGDK